MSYEIRQTLEAENDLLSLSCYIMDKFKNKQAAKSFIADYRESMVALEHFPFGFRGVSIGCGDYEIRVRPFRQYNVFFYVNKNSSQVVILRVLHGLQDWRKILRMETEYHFA